MQLLLELLVGEELMPRSWLKYDSFDSENKEPLYRARQSICLFLNAKTPVGWTFSRLEIKENEWFCDRKRLLHGMRNR